MTIIIITGYTLGAGYTFGAHCMYPLVNDKNELLENTQDLQ
jgi:hypothetical protein